MKCADLPLDLAAPPSLPRASVPVGAPDVMAEGLRMALGEGEHALVLWFAAPGVDRRAASRAMQAAFPGQRVVGCTTAGEIGRGGRVTGTVSACALPASEFRVVHTVIPDVRGLPVAESQRIVQRLLGELRSGDRAQTGATFALLLVDGMSRAEELLGSMLSNALGEVPLVGGSAGDGLDFGCTHVFADGEAWPHGAVLVLVQTALPFEVFKTQHFVSGQERLVVTGADSARRIVYEIDGVPAATRFAALVGVHEDALDPMLFATNPMVVHIGGADYVRSIQQAGPDGSLSFYCAIEEGIVLRDARGVDMVENLRSTAHDLSARIGSPALTIAFDCILRGLECERNQTTAEVGWLLDSLGSTGFSTYGEQFRGLHVNQTLTGVAIGRHRSV